MFKDLEKNINEAIEKKHKRLKIRVYGWLSQKQYWDIRSSLLKNLAVKDIEMIKRGGVFSVFPSYAATDFIIKLNPSKPTFAERAKQLFSKARSAVRHEKPTIKHKLLTQFSEAGTAILKHTKMLEARGLLVNSALLPKTIEKIGVELANETGARPFYCLGWQRGVQLAEALAETFAEHAALPAPCITEKALLELAESYNRLVAYLDSLPERSARQGGMVARAEISRAVLARQCERL